MNLMKNFLFTKNDETHHFEKIYYFSQRKFKHRLVNFKNNL